MREMQLGFWKWLFRGLDGAQPGTTDIAKQYFGRWGAICIVGGVVASMVVESRINVVAKDLMLPLTASLVAVALSVIASVLELVRVEQVRKVEKFIPGGFPQLVYSALLSLLIVVLVVLLWAVAGTGIYDNTWPLYPPLPEGEEWRRASYEAIKACHFVLLAIQVRESWRLLAHPFELLLLIKRVDEIDRK